MNPKIKRLFVSIFLVLVIGGVIREIVTSMPSSSVTIYSGPVGGTYYQMALEYRNELSAMGYDVTIKPTDSTAKLLESVNNSQDPNTIGFMIGQTDSVQFPEIRSLGFVDVQPLFLFYSSAYGELISLATLKGRAIAMPPKDSITTQTALKLLSLYGIDTENTNIEFLPFREAVAAVRNGDVYALFLMLGAENPVIDELVKDSNLNVFSYRDITGILNKLKDMTRVVIPATSYDVLRQIPVRPIDLLAGQVEIIANQNLDKPATYALLNTFENIHHAATLTNPVDTYPSYAGLLAKPNEIAATFNKTGTPWLYRTFPSGLAVLIDKYLIFGLAIFLLTEIYRSLRYLYEFLALSAETLALSILKRFRLRQQSGKRIGMISRFTSRWAEGVVNRKSIRQKAAEMLGDQTKKP
jgi:TRAP-type uncharacterized transport system substrate-binding protein